MGGWWANTEHPHRLWKLLARQRNRVAIHPPSHCCCCYHPTSLHGYSTYCRKIVMHTPCVHVVHYSPSVCNLLPRRLVSIGHPHIPCPSRDWGRILCVAQMNNLAAGHSAMCFKPCTQRNHCASAFACWYCLDMRMLTYQVSMCSSISSVCGWVMDYAWLKTFPKNGLRLFDACVFWRSHYNSSPTSRCT